MYSCDGNAEFVNTVFVLLDLSEIRLICWFGAWGTFINIKVENNFSVSKEQKLFGTEMFCNIVIKYNYCYVW